MREVFISMLICRIFNSYFRSSMRFWFGFLFILMSSGLFAQEEKSLLWEISGNGLEKTSYLYGTMHVSSKIAFRLDDIFYEALANSELIALESDPGTWLEDRSKIAPPTLGYGNGFVSKGFYTRPFSIKNPSRELLASYLSFDDRIVNSILYRSNDNSENFEEETYLDMFIYQAGKKYDKPIIALENLEESSALVSRANLKAMKPKPDEWLQKKMQTQDVLSLLQDAYRARNLNLIDSLDQAIYTDYYLKNMLYSRNKNMIRLLDSVMQKAKVFAGIGAAHLPGKNGVIQLLRDKGYNVQPLVSKASHRGKALKDSLERKILENEYVLRSTDDNLFKIALPNKLYPIAENTNTTYIAPDLANGSYVLVNRIPTYSFLKKDQTYSLESIDKLLYENIPGKILEKVVIDKATYPGLDIKNQLKNGNHQRYQIYLTPLEIVIFKMSGREEYVLQYSDTIFNSIEFRGIDKYRKVLSPEADDFSVEMPSVYRFPNTKRKGNRYIEGYDPETASYFFLKKATLNDFNFIESDTFELKQIQTRFYEDLELNPTYHKPTEKILRSSANFYKKDSKKLYLQTSINANEYFLLGVLTQDSTQANRFFNSFTTRPANYTEQFKTVQDTAMFFSTISPIPPPKFVENSQHYHHKHSKPKPYSAFSKKTIYQHKNNEAILVTVNKSHDFLMFPTIDSVWALRKKIYAQNTFKIEKETHRTLNENTYELNLVLTDTASSRGIKVKNIVKGGLLYEVKTTVDTQSTPSRFIREFYDNFTPSDTLIGWSLLQDKTDAFFKAIRQNDSILYDGYPFIKFDKKDQDSLKYYISQFYLPDNQKYLEPFLIEKLAQLKGVDATDFFESYYAKSYSNSIAQTKILQAISKKSDEKSLSLLLRLMSTDLPLVSSKQEIHNIFQPYLDSLPLAKKLFPEILDYSAIEEYKSPIFSLLAKLKTRGLIKPKKYQKYRHQILNDAKIQLKRQLGMALEQGPDTGNTPKLHDNSYEILENYAVLLYPFLKETETASFFNRLPFIKDPNIQSSFIALVAKNDEKLVHNPTFIPDGLIENLAKNPKNRLLLFNKLKAIGKLHLLPEAYRTQEAIAEALIFHQNNLTVGQDYSTLLLKKNLCYPSKEYTGYYFKVRDKDNYDNPLSLSLLVFKNSKNISATPHYFNNGFPIEDIITEKQLIELSTEQYILKDRQRAMVLKPAQFGTYVH
ncbi:TraB/GumN family protein [Arenibacter sp. 6A1]|uniref:TraB/GumN family protein n=1 Tax=Arenibacter sp. 6A1 TaxID=2720391 RepID=UPI001F0E49D0|nr:TraB/GumN family protein [Arenibacter sp. 6A1]